MPNTQLGKRVFFYVLDLSGPLNQKMCTVSNSQEDYMNSKNTAKAMIVRPHLGVCPYPRQRDKNELERGAWQATMHREAKSWTGLEVT